VSRLGELDLDQAVLVEIDFQGWVLNLAHDPAVVEHAVAVRATMAARPRICTRYLDTELASLLHDLDTRTVVLTGLLTAHGVASAAMSARERGLDVIVVGPACADVTSETHARALDALRAEGVTVVDI
jgi:nicotinamidase-related amidase